jgi:hypothetical protein
VINPIKKQMRTIRNACCFLDGPSKSEKYGWMISAVPTGLISGNSELNPSRKVGKKSEIIELIATSPLQLNPIEKLLA